jgi:hypothetical protein
MFIYLYLLNKLISGTI